MVETMEEEELVVMVAVNLVVMEQFVLCGHQETHLLETITPAQI